MSPATVAVPCWCVHTTINATTNPMATRARDKRATSSPQNLLLMVVFLSVNSSKGENGVSAVVKC